MLTKRKRDIFFVKVLYEVNRTYKCKSGKIITQSLKEEYKTSVVDGFQENLIDKIAKKMGVKYFNATPKLDKREIRWIKLLSLITICKLGKTTYKI